MFTSRNLATWVDDLVRSLAWEWTIGGAADAARAGEAAASLIQILDEMRRDPESYRADFVLARQKVLEALLMQSSSSATIVDRLELLARTKGARSFP